MRILLFSYFKTTLLRILQKTLEFWEVTICQHHAAAAPTTHHHHDEAAAASAASSIYKMLLTFERKYLILLEPLILFL